MPIARTSPRNSRMRMVSGTRATMTAVARVVWRSIVSLRVWMNRLTDSDSGWALVTSSACVPDLVEDRDRRVLVGEVLRAVVDRDAERHVLAQEPADVARVRLVEEPGAQVGRADGVGLLEHEGPARVEPVGCHGHGHGQQEREHAKDGPHQHPGRALLVVGRAPLPPAAEAVPGLVDDSEMATKARKTPTTGVPSRNWVFMSPQCAGAAAGTVPSRGTGRAESGGSTSDRQ